MVSMQRSTAPLPTCVCGSTVTPVMLAGSSEFQEQVVPFAHKRHMSSLESCERIVLVMQRFVGGPD